MHFRMDWRSITFDWNRARAFLVTAEEGSLSAAARALGMAQPTLGRQVSALEDELGVALFERTGRGLELTPTGIELVDHVRAMGAAATRISLAASGQSQEIAGRVCITASEIYSAYLLPAVVAELRQNAPGLEIEINATNAVTDLRRREADIAIRNTAPKDPALTAKRIAEDTGWFYASEAYLARRGTPQGLEDFAGHDFVAMDSAEQMIGALAAVETAVVVISAGAGIEVNTRRAFQAAGDAGLGRMILVNKCDMDNVDFAGLVDEIQEAFGRACVPLNVPVGTGGDFSGVISTLDVPSDVPDGVELDPSEVNQSLMDSIVEADEELMERYLEGEVLSQAELSSGVTAAIASGTLIPIFCSSSKTDVGVDEFLSGLVSCLRARLEIGNQFKESTFEVVQRCKFNRILSLARP